MLDKLSNFFTVFDFIGYILVGYYQMLCIKSLLTLYNNEWLIKTCTFYETISFNMVIVAFVFGILIQSFSNALLDANENKKKENHSPEILTIRVSASKFFNLEIHNPLVWEHLYLYVLSSKHADNIRPHWLFYFLLRGLKASSIISICFTFTLILITYLDTGAIFPEYNKIYLIIFLFFHIASYYLFTLRANRTWSTAEKKTYVAFALEIHNKSMQV